MTSVAWASHRRGGAGITGRRYYTGVTGPSTYLRPGPWVLTCAQRKGTGRESWAWHLYTRRRHGGGVSWACHLYTKRRQRGMGGIPYNLIPYLPVRLLAWFIIGFFTSLTRGSYHRFLLFPHLLCESLLPLDREREREKNDLGEQPGIEGPFGGIER